ncbi:UNVERIFIED_CONTAM: hypothetical protein HDU68_006741 [Siphonaria sp. JEL0065]|nr:hypothetical protein HDU68_006741 [Siphonaria sp. JEL0065]
MMASSVEVPPRNTSLSDLSIRGDRPVPTAPPSITTTEEANAWKSLIAKFPAGSPSQKSMFHIDEIISNQSNFVRNLNVLYEVRSEVYFSTSVHAMKLRSIQGVSNHYCVKRKYKKE